MLIVLRGNSGSGKSSTAKLLRDAMISDRHIKVALVEQDYLRRIVLKEPETEGTDNIDLIQDVVQFGLDRGYIVILEGILSSERYGRMLEDLHKRSISTYFYYLDVSLDESLRRHDTKPNAHEFGEAEIREWYVKKDLLEFVPETVIVEASTQREAIRQILNDLKHEPR